MTPAVSYGKCLLAPKVLDQLVGNRAPDELAELINRIPRLLWTGLGRRRSVDRRTLVFLDHVST